MTPEERYWIWYNEVARWNEVLQSRLDVKREAYEALADIVWVRYMECWEKSAPDCEKMWR